MTGSIRSFKKQNVQELPEIMENTIKEICEKNGCEYKIEFKEISNNPVINNPKCTEYFMKIAGEKYGKEAITDEGTPSFGSEDFADYLDVIPGCFFWRLTTPKTPGYGLHTSKFDFDDSVIQDVAELFCTIVLERTNSDE